MPVRPEKLPTLVDLRTRRADAMRAASRRLIPRLLASSATILPAIVAAVLMQTGRLEHRFFLFAVLGSALINAPLLGWTMLDYLRRIVPEEFAKAGLLCHACGKPLAPKPQTGNASVHRAQITDPDVLAAIDGKCASCGTWVVRDAIRGAA